MDIKNGTDVENVVSYYCKRSAEAKSAAVIKLPEQLLSATLEALARHGMKSKLESAQRADVYTCTGSSTLGFWVIDLEVDRRYCDDCGGYAGNHASHC